MPYASFHDYFPQIAEKETRTIAVFDPDAPVPPDEYALVEMFCDEPGCDCRRVFLAVISSQKRRIETVIAYGWESREFYVRWFGCDEPEVIRELQGPVLNLGSPHSPIAPEILDMVDELVLSDEIYVERVKRHYRMFRDVIDHRISPSARKKLRQRARQVVRGR
jgi:hypothetical protein